ncbi:hypothetical protein PPTG_21766 [Phytophthora nicotianae INRA-310]|uniref:Uncharacterized protein n=1 Tax=Phytophthora nicotianae (strain INRA-310) TaxID=761204 RepID=W2QUF0_PHYN3|nr:hypothetical protein PPTG_21766 [Phytophthora nicotianae INRA-310]ETN16733.1 hypothetical protein PPTG_21766 [Phytophthora nicotianae INRA-310]
MTQSFGTEDLPSSAQDLASLLVLVESRRDVEGQDRLPKSTEFRESGIQSLTAKEFRLITRVSHFDFFRIISEIETNEFFQNNSGCGEAPVWLQLVVALNRLGNYGNGVSLGRTQKLWGIGQGTCALYTTRVLLALKYLATKFVVWPDAEERRSISRRMEQRGFRGCVGFIAGITKGDTTGNVSGQNSERSDESSTEGGLRRSPSYYCILFWLARFLV